MTNKILILNYLHNTCTVETMVLRTSYMMLYDIYIIALA